MRLKEKISIRVIYLLCLIGFAMASCKSYYSTLIIETPTPAKEELPEDIQSLTLMNRSINNQFMDHQKDTLENHFYRHNYQLAAIVLDKDAADTTLLSLADLLYASGRYDVVVPVERDMKKENAYNVISDTLSSETVRQICTEYNTDALLVMEQFSTKAITDLTTEKLTPNSNGSSYYYASLDIKYNAFFRIYQPGRKTIEISITDTIYWENADFKFESLFVKIPSIKQAVINAGIKVALDVDSKISPSWIQRKRGFFVLDRRNDQTKQWMDENNTAKARDYWMQMIQSDKKKIKSRAEYNLALASELDGDIDQAIQWAIKSYNTLYQHQTEIYLKRLKARKESNLTK